VSGKSWNSKKVFQQTDRHPDTHGLAGPLNLTARWSSAALELFLTVSFHLDAASAKVLIATMTPSTYYGGAKHR